MTTADRKNLRRLTRAIRAAHDAGLDPAELEAEHAAAQIAVFGAPKPTAPVRSIYDLPIARRLHAQDAADARRREARNA